MTEYERKKITTSDAISRKEVLQFLEDMKIVAPNHDIISETAMVVIKCVRRFVTAMPSADTVPVVRCGECDWWTKQESSIQGRCALYGIYPTSAWYCANGKRREDGDNDG